MDELLRDMGNLLKTAAGKPLAERRREVLQAVSATVSRAFALGPDELAIFILSPDRMTVRFLWPPEMAGGGSSFPVTAGAFAHHVIKTGSSLLSNAVRELRHLGFYERIRIQEHSPRVIQKLLAVPVKGADGQVRGVIEISRRGKSRAETGRDFRPEDQQVLEQLAALAASAVEEAFAALRF